MTPQQEKERGIQAQRLLNDPLIDEAFMTLKARLEEERDGSKPGDTDLRERVHFQLQQLKELRHFFENLVTNGKMMARMEAKVKTRRERDK